MPSLAKAPSASIQARRDASKEKATALRKTVDDNIDALASAVDVVRASESFKAYLTCQARFHNYSWHNTMLIYSQCPTASRIAGFKTWQSMKRQVRKGERGIMIFAPRTFKKDPKPGSDEAETGVYFRPVHVFDIGQTDGPDLPDVDVPTIEVVADDLLGKLVGVAVSRGIALTFKDIPDDVFGVSCGGSIEVNNTHTTGQQAKTLAHELAHEALHKAKLRGPITRNIAELEAESVAFVVCTHFGLDCSVRASRYIAIWNGNGKELRASLDRISKTARAIIDDATSAQSERAVA